MKEIIKPVEGHEEFYSISNYGYIISNSYINKQGKRVRSRILKNSPNKKGQYYVKLSDGGGNQKTLGINRLVYLNFIGAIELNHQIEHINKDKSNNREDNLIKVNKHNISNTTTFKIFYNRIESFGKTWNNKELRIDRMTRKRIGIKMTKEITK